MSQTSLTALIVEPNAPRRVRLRHVLQAIPQYETVLQSSCPHEALKTLTEHGSVQVVFLGGGLERDAATAFVAAARKIPEGAASAYILMADSYRESSTAVAINLMEGVDGQLLEPFSVDGVRDVTEIALRLCRQRAEARARYAIELLISEIANQLDTVAELRAMRAEARTSLRLLDEMCRAAHALEPSMRLFFVQKVADVFEARPAPKRKLYAGPSNRLRARSAAQHDSKVDLPSIRKWVSAAA